MFTPGRIAFAVSFFIVFIIYLIWAYKYDHRAYGLDKRSAITVLIFILIFFGIYWTLTRLLHS
ncbi:MAG: hypothetical protein KatS3mg034_1944 [Vicingaceae bacterium]|nr:MAG: hypothetical protein KatS3mg034_1944 [Vicingaceae bacterium]